MVNFERRVAVQFAVFPLRVFDYVHRAGWEGLLRIRRPYKPTRRLSLRRSRHFVWAPQTPTSCFRLVVQKSVLAVRIHLAPPTSLYLRGLWARCRCPAAGRCRWRGCGWPDRRGPAPRRRSSADQLIARAGVGAMADASAFRLPAQVERVTRPRIAATRMRQRGPRSRIRWKPCQRVPSSGPVLDPESRRLFRTERAAFRRASTSLHWRRSRASVRSPLVGFCCRYCALPPRSWGLHPDREIDDRPTIGPNLFL
jgi:hypothetical protein